MTSPGIKSSTILAPNRIVSIQPSKIPVLISRTKAYPTTDTENTATTTSMTTTNFNGTNSSPKKSVTLTLLPLPARRSSLTSDKKLSGILKNTNISLPQNENSKIGVSAELGLNRNIQKQKIRSDKRSLKTVEKWLPNVKSIHHDIPLESEIHFNKRDSFSDTSSSGISYSSPSAELSISSAAGDTTRLSSTTSGYESDEMTLNMNMKISDISKQIVQPKTPRNNNKQNMANPWLSFRNFQNIDILTEKEILALNARLERLFDVYKKLERNRSIKGQESSKNLDGNYWDKYSHVKAKVQSNAPQCAKPSVGSKAKKHNLSSSADSKIFQKQKFKYLLKKEPLNHLKSLKNCFRGSEVSKSPIQQNRTHKQIADHSKHSTSRTYNHPSDHLRMNDVINRAKISSDRSLTIMRDIDLMKIRQTRSAKQSSKRFALMDDDSPRAQSPLPLPQDVVTRRMANFKCPRVKQRSSETSIDRKLICDNISSSPRRMHSSETRNKFSNDHNVRRSNPALWTMKLPKRLSRPELEEVKRSSSRSLAGHGYLGSPMFVEKRREITNNDITTSRDSKINKKSYCANSKSLRTPSLEIKSNKANPCFPAFTSLSGIHSMRQSLPREIQNRNFLKEKHLMGNGSVLRNITDTSSISGKRNRLSEMGLNIVTTV